jgi:hypothetical protein
MRSGVALEAFVGRPEADHRNVLRALDRMRADAGDGTYTPAVIAHWNGTAPTTIAEALDRIAAFIGPIP